jgi:Flp pilus assembly protein TadG
VREKAVSYPRRKAASGQAVIESIVSIILFVMLLALVMSISVYLYFQQALVTAAREGARQASLSSSIGTSSTESSGISSVQSFVQTEIQQLTGQTYSPSVATITVTPPSNTSVSPDQTPGRRNVRVVIQWQMQNPIGISGFINALGGNGNAFNKIPVTATATMRYEE